MNSKKKISTVDLQDQLHQQKKGNFLGGETSTNTSNPKQTNVLNLLQNIIPVSNNKNITPENLIPTAKASNPQTLTSAKIDIEFFEGIGDLVKKERFLPKAKELYDAMINTTKERSKGFLERVYCTGYFNSDNLIKTLSLDSGHLENPDNKKIADKDF